MRYYVNHKKSDEKIKIPKEFIEASSLSRSIFSKPESSLISPPRAIIKNLSLSKRLVIVDDTAQQVGAFKIRGAFAGVFSEIYRNRCISKIHVASSGSFGMSVSKVATGLEVFVHMPKTTPCLKQVKIRKNGASVLANYNSYEQAKAAAIACASKSQASTFIDGVSWDVFAGNATLIQDVINQGTVPRDRCLMLIPLGIGSLLIPTALQLAQHKIFPEFIAIEPETFAKTPSYMGHSIHAPYSETIADGAAVKELPYFTIPMIVNICSGVSLISEEEITFSIQKLWTEQGIKAEGAGALAYSVISSNPSILSDFDDIWVFVTGNNIHSDIFDSCLNYKQ